MGTRLDDGRKGRRRRHVSPQAITIALLIANAKGDIRDWLRDRRNRRTIPHRLEQCGYTPVRNDAADDGLWKVGGKRQAIYAGRDFSIRDQMAAAKELIGRK